MFLLIKLAWRNLKRHLKKSLLLGSLILVSMFVLFIANSIFLGTTDGMKKTFIGSFTGDLVISSSSETAFSLFGNEIPIISDLEIIPPLMEHSQVLESLDGVQHLEAYASIVSVPSRMTIEDKNSPVALFGVDPETYFSVCSDVVIEQSYGSDLSSGGVYINQVLAREMEEKLNRPLNPGEQVSFSIYLNNSFKIRSAPLLGVIEYTGSIEALDKVVIADLVTVRSLAGYTLGYSVSDGTGDESSETEDDFNFDDLFAEDTDLTGENTVDFELEAFEESFEDTSVRDSLMLTDNGAWSFVLIRAQEGKSRVMIREIKKELGRKGLDVDLLSWRRAAGSSALILFAIQSIFYLGLGFLGIGAVLVIMNALVFSVLERAGEIGTMRSLGATPGFIRLLFMLESLIITVSGAALGIFFGSSVSFAIKISQIKLANPLLVSLFGGDILNPMITPQSILIHLLIALVIGGLAWIYPVSLAVKIQPVTAINRG